MLLTVGSRAPHSNQSDAAPHIRGQRTRFSNKGDIPMKSNQESEPAAGRGPLARKHVSQGRGLWLISCALGFVALWGAVLSDGALPTALGRMAHESRFSSARAMDVLVEWLGKEGAHPVGSPAGARIRERLVETLTLAGADVEVQRAWVQNAERPSQVALVHNVVGHFPGNGEGQDALLISHYDSVGAGPGAADDLAGAAAWIEAVLAFRELTQGEHKTGLWVLITEGEEDGLFGAQAFADKHQAMDRIGLVVNLEARGATGVSRLFETSLGNGPWIDMYSKHVERPSASSLSVEIYRRMPNGSDLQVFLEHGLAALNFAFIGDWAVYHSPLDTPERLDPQSLQHQGENALAVLIGLEADDSLLRGESVARGKDVVHVDLLGGFLLQYSMGLQWAAVILILALWFFWWVRLAHKGLTLRNTTVAFAIGGVVVFLPLALMYGALFVAESLAGTSMVFWSRPMPAVALAVGSYFVAIAVVLRLARNCAPVALRFASATGACVWSVILAWFLPGAGFLWVPATLFLMVSLCILQGAWVRKMPTGWGMGWGAFAGAIVISMFVWIPLHHGLLDAFGFQNAAGLLLPVAMPSTLLLPFMWRSRRSVGLASAVIGLLCVGFGWAVAATNEPYTPEKPGTFNVSYTLVEGETVARLKSVDKGFGWPEGVPKVDDNVVSVTPVIAKTLPAPSLTDLGKGSDGEHRYHLNSNRSATRVNLSASSIGLRGVVIEGESFEFPSGRLKLYGVPESGLDLQWLWESEAVGGSAVLSDQTLGLPKHIAAWAALAGTSWVPRHAGHVTWVTREVAIHPSSQVESGD
jgi:hypothetical protein